MCGGGVRSILLLPRVARCIETIDVCIWRMFVCMSCSDCIWECLLCSGVVKDSGSFEPSNVEVCCGVCVRGVIDAVFSVCGAVGCCTPFSPCSFQSGSLASR